MKEERDASGCGHKAEVSHYLEKRNSHQHSENRLVIIPLLAHISTLLDIHETLLAKSRHG